MPSKTWLLPPSYPLSPRKSEASVAKDTNILIRLLAHEGLPLFELVMVLLISSGLWVLHIGAAFQSGERTKAEMNQHRMILLKMAVQGYQWVNSSFPTTLGALVCERQGTRSCIPVANAELLQDVWGTPYVYENARTSFTIKSFGADKQEGGNGPNADVVIAGP
jgi:hypothetical protein